MISDIKCLDIVEIVGFRWFSCCYSCCFCFFYLLIHHLFGFWIKLNSFQRLLLTVLDVPGCSSEPIWCQESRLEGDSHMVVPGTCPCDSCQTGPQFTGRMKDAWTTQWWELQRSFKYSCMSWGHSWQCS